jgi:hypothetical protein
LRKKKDPAPGVMPKARRSIVSGNAVAFVAPGGGMIFGPMFQLPDPLFERHAIKKKWNPSAVPVDILDRNLPKHSITTEE